MCTEDTIAAIATPPGRGGIAIVRVSGCLALKAAEIIAHLNPKPRQAYFRQFFNHEEAVDEGVVIYFQNPNSYTGEDVVEFQGHAGTYAPQRVLQAILSIDGIRLAEPGEFTRRAFLNNKMDLTAAEAVEDLISAGSESAAKAALSSLDGAFAQKLNKLTDLLTNFRVHLEACLDFPEEHEDFFDTGNALKELNSIQQQAQEALQIADQGVKLNEGANIVLSGAPNAGKSSLLNALAGVDKAIVTNIPGTTRDVLTCAITLQGVPVNITDTAGIREQPKDEIEAIGIQKAINELKKADLVLFMVDGSIACTDEILDNFKTVKQFEPNTDRILLIISKSDKTQDASTMELLSSPIFKNLKQIHTSTKVEGGLDELKKMLANALGILPCEGVFSARRRHTVELQHTIEAITRALEILKQEDIVICAQELKSAQDHLGTITGKVTSDDLLGKIFSTFCMGK